MQVKTKIKEPIFFKEVLGEAIKKYDSDRKIFIETGVKSDFLKRVEAYNKGEVLWN